MSQQRIERVQQRKLLHFQRCALLSSWLICRRQGKRKVADDSANSMLMPVVNDWVLPANTLLEQREAIDMYAKADIQTAGMRIC